MVVSFCYMNRLKKELFKLLFFKHKFIIIAKGVQYFQIYVPAEKYLV